MPRERSSQTSVLGQAFGEGVGRSSVATSPLALEVVPMREPAVQERA